MWQDKLNEIIEEEKTYGGELNSGASEEDIMNFLQVVKEKMNIELPEEYLNLLKTVNSMEFNGYKIYGIDREFLINKPIMDVEDFIDSNQVWNEDEDQIHYIFFGDGSLRWCVYDKESEIYIIIGKPSRDELEEFQSFDEMLEKLLSDALQ